MATSTKAAKETSAVTAETPVSEGAQAVSEVVPAQAAKVPVFRDKEFTSRTLILPQGRTVEVKRGQVEAVDAELSAFLKARQDFEPLE
jgi:hypothetical protein